MTRTPFWTITFETPAARNPEYRTAPTASGGMVDSPAAESWAIAIGASTIVPASVAHAVARSGLYRPRNGAPNAR
jgi:hypothetical protein